MSQASITHPTYVAIEGPIGVGKTILAEKISHQMGYELDPGIEPFIVYYHGDMSKVPPSAFLLNRKGGR